ncbi:hypothetical protein [Nocardia jiangsuensis]|uniref:Uncharacterized protein n=1 Tax=Nocardia jiangsuensis TaxID=1691563 RepID=A0ABV8DM94_9NOCA
MPPSTPRWCAVTAVNGKPHSRNHSTSVASPRSSPSGAVARTSSGAATPAPSATSAPITAVARSPARASARIAAVPW